MFLVNSGVFGIPHIVYMFIASLVMVISIIYINKLNEKTTQRIIKIVALCLLITIIINRISVTYFDVVINKRVGYSWLNLIPNSYCGIASFIFSISLLIGKKNNTVLHFITYFGFLGGLITFIYPDFLDSQAFFDIRSITGLLHHTIMLYLSILTTVTKYFIPSIKKWYYFPIGFAFVMLFGIFLKDALGFTKAMQIGEPLLKSLKYLTSWYVIAFVGLILQLVFLIIYEKYSNKKTFKEILSGFLNKSSYN